METKLTSQQILFCQQVASGKNQSEAYNLAYPRSLKWKEDVVRVNASRLMSNANIRLTVDEIIANHAKRNEMTLDKVLKMMAEWLEFDPLQLVDENDCVKSMKDLAPEVRRSLASIEVVELFAGSGEDRRKTGVLKKVKFYEKTKVADMFMKKFGQYIENRNVKFDADSLSHIKEILESIE